MKTSDLSKFIERVVHAGTFVQSVADAKMRHANIREKIDRRKLARCLKAFMVKLPCVDHRIDDRTSVDATLLNSCANVDTRVRFPYYPTNAMECRC